MDEVPEITVSPSDDTTVTVCEVHAHPECLDIAPIALHPDFDLPGDVIIVCGEPKVGFRLSGAMLRLVR